MSEELKPVRCGCGGEAVQVQHELFDTIFKWRIHCMNCGIETRMFDTRIEATEAWNAAMSGNKTGKRIGGWLLTENLAQDCFN